MFPLIATRSAVTAGGEKQACSLKGLRLFSPRRETLFLIKVFHKYLRACESSLDLKGNTAGTQEQRRPLQLVVKDLIGVIIYHANRKVFLN